ncbi:MAG: hypothetical protein Q8K60_01925 [Parachlamydiaceae bacterium]|nr:hypothetical protein [Parachlamydiaceae bacterium]
MEISNNYKSNFFNSFQFSKYKNELTNVFFTSKIFSCIAIATIIGIVIYAATSLFGRVKKKKNLSLEVNGLDQSIESIKDLTIEFNSDFQNSPKSEIAINESISQPIKLSSNKLIELKYFNLLEEDHFIYKDSLEIEMGKINEHLSIPENKAILEYINKEMNPDACAILWVILGIKPVAVFELSIEHDLRNLILNVLKLDTYKDNLKFIDNHQEHPKYYFVNEQPLEAFNPRRYLTKLLPDKQTNSITEAVTYCFPHQGYLQTDQILSYLLGFGPSWEAYTVHVSKFPCNNSIFNQVNDLPFSCFSDAHYFEIGKVLNFLILNTNSINEIDLGKAYLKKLPKLAKKLLPKQNSWIEDQTKYDNDRKNFKNMGINFVFDRITAETDYFKKSYTLRTWVFKTWIDKNVII